MQLEGYYYFLVGCQAYIMIHCPRRLTDRVVGFEYKSLSSVMGGGEGEHPEHINSNSSPSNK